MIDDEKIDEMMKSDNYLVRMDAVCKASHLTEQQLMTFLSDSEEMIRKQAVYRDEFKTIPHAFDKGLLDESPDVRRATLITRRNQPYFLTKEQIDRLIEDTEIETVQEAILHSGKMLTDDQVEKLLVHQEPEVRVVMIANPNYSLSIEQVTRILEDHSGYGDPLAALFKRLENIGERFDDEILNTIIEKSETNARVNAVIINHTQLNMTPAAIKRVIMTANPVAYFLLEQNQTATLPPEDFEYLNDEINSSKNGTKTRALQKIRARSEQMHLSGKVDLDKPPRSTL